MAQECLPQVATLIAVTRILEKEGEIAVRASAQTHHSGALE